MMLVVDSLMDVTSSANLSFKDFRLRPSILPPYYIVACLAPTTTVGRDVKSVSTSSIHQVIVSASLYLDYMCCPPRSSDAVGSVT
jgi:hypothetical protein